MKSIPVRGKYGDTIRTSSPSLIRDAYCVPVFHSAPTLREDRPDPDTVSLCWMISSVVGSVPSGSRIVRLDDGAYCLVASHGPHAPKSALASPAMELWSGTTVPANVIKHPPSGLHE